MPFAQWQPPSEEAFELRALARRLGALVDARIQEKERLHAARVSKVGSAYVINDLEVNIRHLERRIRRIERQALELVRSSARLSGAFDHLSSVKGIADRSAIKLLGELVTLPADMSVRQWVAFAGLDVCHCESGRSVAESGRSVAKPGRISKQGNARLRRALYMPAQVAIRHEPHVRAFYEKLLARGKPKMVAVIAVMRKLLHAIFGMLKHRQKFDGQKFYRIAPQTP